MSSATAKVRAMVVDDSAVVRRHLADTLTAAGIEVIATAPDPVFAIEKMRRDWPDVLVLDVEMPRMDGITFLKQVMAERPTPVVMCSTLTDKGAETTLQALHAGAVGFVTKPKAGLKTFLEDGANDIVAAVRAAACANVANLRKRAPVARRAVNGPITIRTSTALAETTDRVIAIGVSTGGVQAIETVLTQLPRTAPGIVIVQHMPEKFTASLAARLATLCQVDVSEAKHADRVLTGRVLIAPGGRHMRLARSGAQYMVEVLDGPVVNHHRPSVDVLFRSVANVAGRNAVGIIMTGMGDDGARGLLELHRAGAHTIAQDEASSVVFGMPKEAIALGAVDEVLPLDRLAGAIERSASRALKPAAGVQASTSST